MVDVIKSKYQIVREIARSNDIVYEAVDTTLGRRIAIKELNVATGIAPQARRDRIERFNREARAAGRLGHPNIVSVFDFGEDNGRHFIAMEYLEGQNLRDAMQVRGAYPLREALDIACQVLDGLGYAHANRVVHRDIKPDNIQILPGGQAKITDFGIARLSEEPALTGDGQVFGTPSYMSPEQIEGKTVDLRTDLFSLAIVLYEMLAGRKPFVGDSVVAITYAIMNAEPPQMHGVPAGIEQVIRRALSKQPSQRPVSAEQMKLDLRNAEQTPAIFLPPQQPIQTNMGRTGYGYMGTGPSVPPMPAAGYMPPLADPAGRGLPWSWNTNPPQPGQMGQTPMPYAVVGVPQMAGPGGINPYSAPPYPDGPPQPLFVMSPGMRSFLISVAVASLLGGGLALGCIWFMKSYSDYQTKATSAVVSSDMSKGQSAYAAADYSAAATDFEQALQAGPDARQRPLALQNLGYTYVQLARQARARGDLDGARAAYQHALTYAPDYQVANAELAAVLQQLGDNTGASERRSTAESGLGPANGPPAVLPTAPPPASEPSPPSDPNEFVNQQRAAARDLIMEGSTLYQQGNVDGARDKWTEAIAKGAGYPEADQAQKLLDTYSGASSQGNDQGNDQGNNQ